ncbi:MAG: Gfo/Idh/MocA family oxidoreductase [Bacteroidetes bacterium]|nr:Gfo/Idh/MocA family oxidoreductase [Bacteroidota bacterium]
METATDSRAIGIGILGYGSMGRAHASACLRLPQVFWPPAARPELVAVCGRSADRVEDFARRFGFGHWYRDWRELVADPNVQVFDDAGPNDLHEEPCVAAAQAGKHVLCEKPLARNAGEAWRMLQAVEAAGVRHMCGFVYRFVPAVRVARQLIEAGALGRIYHYRARYLQAGAADPATPLRWRHQAEAAGSGALGDVGSHIIDLARFLVGEPESVQGALATLIPERNLEQKPGERGPVTSDDAFAAAVTFRNGAIGTLEASRVCWGRWNHLEFEVNGEKGSLAFNLERMNELELYLEEDRRQGVAGTRTVNCNEPEHPFAAQWWPRHPLGWDALFVHQLQHFLAAVAGRGEVAPLGATFDDGYRCAVVCDAIASSAATGRRTVVEYKHTEV